MIDAHAHAYPAPADHAKRLEGPLGLVKGMVGSVLPKVVAKAEQLTPLLGAAAGAVTTTVADVLPDVPVDVEKLAALRRMGPLAAQKAAELGMSLTLLPQVLLRGSFDHLEASMRRHGIERTVVIASGPVAPNEWVLEQCAQRGEGFVPVCVLPQLPPHSDEEAYRAAFLELVERGARGFKIHPNFDDLPPHHPAYRALFEVASAQGRFVILHTGCFSVLGYRHLRPADARDFTTYFQDHPEVKVCLAHMNRDHPEEAWELMHRFPQLYADTSWQPQAQVRRALATVGAERLMLGSDWPLLRRDLQGEMVRIAEAVCSGPDLEQLSKKSALAFFGEAA